MRLENKYTDNDATELDSYGIEVASNVDENTIFNGWKQFS